MTVEPEHGANGYQHELPFTCMPVADLWKVNLWMKNRQLQRMSQLPFWAK
jgi:hypothetical protein